MAADNNNPAKTLLKAISDSTKRLDSIYSNGKAIKTVFSYEAYGQRLRLKELLQKLMFMNPKAYCRRSEELIWRKVFYEPLHLYKTNVKNNDRADWVAHFEMALKMHIISGIGYYQSLLLQMQNEHAANRDLRTWLAVPFHIPVYNVGIFDFEQTSPTVYPVGSFGCRIFQKCLLYIGDLFRYLTEFDEPVGKSMAYGYYNAALNFEPNFGLPHNQLGILDVGRCYGLNAMYHYLLCLSTQSPFEGARRNLSTVLSKNEARFHRFFGKLPVFGLYAHRPYIYRPKMFWKTITKFITLMHLFLDTQVVRSNVSRETLPQLFQDTICELHLMLSLSSKVTLEPRGLCSSPMGDSVDDQPVLARRDSAVFSERLTGPIFVRILLIALLIANLKVIEGKQSTQLSPSTCAGVDQSEGTSTGDMSDIDMDDSRASHRPIIDLNGPYGPVCFLFRLSEVYVAHLIAQLDTLLPISLDSSEGADVEARESNSGEQIMEECVKTDLVTRDDTESTENNHHEMHTLESKLNLSDESSDDGHLPVRRRVRNLTLSSDESETAYAGQRPSEMGENEWDEDAEDEDYWSSGASSPFHSQDELDSADGLSTRHLIAERSIGPGDSLNRSAATSDGRQSFVVNNECNEDGLYPAGSGSTTRDTTRTPRNLPDNAERYPTPVRSRYSSTRTHHLQQPLPLSFTGDNGCCTEPDVKESTKLHKDEPRYSKLFLQANAISRLYLLSTVKLVADWVHYANPLNVILPTLKHDQPSLVVCIIQSWFNRLSVLLNQLYVTVTEIRTELSTEGDIEKQSCLNNEKVRTEDFTKSQLFHDFMTDFGKSLLTSVPLHCHLPNGENDAGSDDIDNPPTTPLPEDWLLRGLPILSSLHDRMSFDKAIVDKPITLLDESLHRILSLIQHAQHLEKQSTEHNLDFKIHLESLKPFHSHATSGDDDLANFYIHPARNHPDRYPNRPRPFSRRNRGRGKHVRKGKNKWQPGTRKVSYRALRHPTDFYRNGPNEPDASTEHESRSSEDMGEYTEDITKQSSNSCITPTYQKFDAVETENSSVKNEHRKVQSMQDMARLRLLSQVDMLSRQCQSTSGGGRSGEIRDTADPHAQLHSGNRDASANSAGKFVSPYLVLDAYCLATHLTAVKQLANSHSFLLITPITVISHLDYMKKTMATARVAIRYLEQETQAGNRFIRLQRPEEQPPESVQVERSISSRPSAASEISETANESSSDTVTANPRVVNRWFNILNCAVHFSKEQDQDSNKTTGETAPISISNDPSLYCDLLSSNLLNELSDQQTGDTRPLVTILVGSRDVLPEDTIVPQEFLNLVRKYGIHIELMRDFMQRWRSRKI